jgi:23S rRNA pseudouridine2605 synthase
MKLILPGPERRRLASRIILFDFLSAMISAKHRGCAPPRFVMTQSAVHGTIFRRGRKMRQENRFSRDSRRVGLARALSKLGYCSRSQAAKLIRAGRVHLNGTVRRDPESPVQIERDRIDVDGRSVRSVSKIYLMLNKPRGVVTTASDEQGRETVYSRLGEGLPWVGPVGRLDKASEGLLLLTNDSEWAARISDPNSHLEKVYHVQIGKLADENLAATLVAGVRSGTGDTLRAKQARILRAGERNAWLEIVLDEGKNRQIRRMFEGLGIEVLRLIRISIGPLQLGKLAKGEVRALTPTEKRLLDGAVQESAPRSAKGQASRHERI